MPITRQQWQATRTALAETGERFGALVAASDPRAMATADWSVADTAAHVASLASMNTGIVRFDGPPVPALREHLLASTVDDVAEFNVRLLALTPERDHAAAARGLRADIDDILRATEDADPEATVPWLGDSRLPIGGVLAHLVNELQIHGRDIARATHAPWTIPPAEAALFLEVFLVGLLRHGVGQALDNDEPPRERRIAVEFRSRYTTPVTVVLHRGRVSVEEPGGETDVRITFHPPTLNLLMFHRISTARAVLSGGVRVSGRRPWLLPVFLRTVRVP